MYKLWDNFWLWDSLGLMEWIYKEIFQKWNIPYLMGKTSREFGWRRSNTELIRIFFQTVPKTIKIDPDYWKIYSSPSIYTREVSYTSIETAVNKLSWHACFLSKKKETTSLNAFKLTLTSIKYHQNVNCELSDTQMI